MDEQNRTKSLDRYLSPVDVWSMAFGVMVGWGVFAMPGNTFLPVAEPAGTLISMALGMVIMLIIGRNFSCLMGSTAITGGVYSYTKEAFGRDHAFLSSWFLCLSYLTIVFLNGTALFYIIRMLMGGAVLMLIIFVGLTVMLYVQNYVRKKHEALEREKIRAAEEAGMNGHIAKPIDIQVMMKTITDVLNGR